MGNGDWNPAFYGGTDEEREQPYAKTLFVKLSGHLESKYGESLQNHEVLEKALQEIRK